VYYNLTEEEARHGVTFQARWMLGTGLPEWYNGPPYRGVNSITSAQWTWEVHSEATANAYVIYAVPEPAPIATMSVGAVGLLAFGRFRKTTTPKPVPERRAA
jgi:hypothetical protein